MSTAVNWGETAQKKATAQMKEKILYFIQASFVE